MQDQTRGARAEQLAETFLCAQGLRLLSRNYRCKAGEIDLIMEAGETLVFVEVRLRTHPDYARAAESVGWRKQHKVIRAAQHYLQRHDRHETRRCRFDVVGLNSLEQTDNIEWIQHAFDAS